MNPWNVSSINHFIFFCCPECDIKVKDSQDFINHALEIHEQAKDSSSIKSEIKLKDREEDIIILESKPIKRKAEDPVTNPIMKRRHVIEQIESHDDTVSQQVKEDDNNTDAAGDTPLADLNDHESDETESLEVTEEPIETGEYLCFMCETITSSEEELLKHVEEKHSSDSKDRIKRKKNKKCYEKVEPVVKMFRKLGKDVEGKNCPICGKSLHPHSFGKHKRQCEDLLEEETGIQKPHFLDFLTKEQNIVPSKPMKRKIEHSVTIPILKRRDVIEKVEDHEDTKSKHHKKDDTNSDAEDVKDQMNDINEHIEDYDDTVSRQVKEEDDSNSDADFVLEDIADEVSSSEEELSEHITKKLPSASKESELKTSSTNDDDCDKIKRKKNKAYRKVRTRHTDVSTTCDICGKNVRHLKNHLELMHPKNGEEVTCDQCGKKMHASRLKYHISTRHTEASTTCDICGHVLGSLDASKLHRLNKHHIRQRFRPEVYVKKCDKCDTEFKSSEEMDNHSQECHKSDKQYKCKDCDKIWVSHLALELHYVEEHKKVIFCCDICGYERTALHNIKRHKRWKHEGKKDHVCHICGDSFTQPNKLKQHLAAKHDIGEARFKCDICNKILCSQQQYKVHMEGVHLKNVKYNCDQCNHSTNTHVALNKHKLRIHRKPKK